MNRTIRQMQNELTRLKMGEIFVPTNQNVRVPMQDQRVINDINEEHRPKAPRMPNLNVVVLEEIGEEESFDNDNQKPNITQEDILESVQTYEGTSFLYIFDEHENLDIA
jgi:hypothetical protein